MNALQKLYIVSHPLRISRYGAHTSLSTAERVEIIDVLTDTLGTVMTLLAQFKRGQQKLHNISFLPVQQMFHRMVRANTDYADFLVARITDLGGYAETAALYHLHDIREPQCFADCLTGISQGTRRLQAVEALLRDYRECAIDHKDNASKRFFEACTRQNAHFIWLIEDNLAQEQPW
ncbi:ferritin-like domain-containing protein [Pseudomonas baetica]|uniref:ferritin-like domain-containing protein n=1 Tax=Pseudomonas baetica TaxID=674054 RepID=UPI003EE934AB